MEGELIFGIILLGIVILMLVLFIVFGLRFSAQFSKIEVGMTYEEVITMVGEPRSSTTSQDILTCIWKRAIIRGWTKVFTVTFRFGKVVSVVDG